MFQQEGRAVKPTFFLFAHAYWRFIAMERARRRKIIKRSSLIQVLDPMFYGGGVHVA